MWDYFLRGVIKWINNGVRDQRYSTRRMLVSTADGSDVDMPTLPILYGLSAETVAERGRTLPFGKRWPRALRSVINGI